MDLRELVEGTHFKKLALASSLNVSQSEFSQFINARKKIPRDKRRKLTEISQHFLGRLAVAPTVAAHESRIVINLPT